jgi:hypothetical protein
MTAACPAAAPVDDRGQRGRDHVHTMWWRVATAMGSYDTVGSSDGWIWLLIVTTIGFTILYFVIKRAVVNGMREVLRTLGANHGMKPEAETRKNFDGVVARIKRHDATDS